VLTLSMSINPPGWHFLLAGNLLSNGGFEDVYTMPWDGIGNLSAAVNTLSPYSGKASLSITGSTAV